MATAAPKHDRSKTAIIVGASRGLGLGLAREFARRGWHVTATARNASKPRANKQLCVAARLDAKAA
jgi:NAD(P)-dependent dehydrogenase (short-subunit alcohol dehydrogenase family)